MTSVVEVAPGHTVEMIRDDADPEVWHVNVNVPWDTPVIFSVAQHRTLEAGTNDPDARYIDLEIRGPDVTIYSAAGS